jgi:hypothetical protein
MLMPYLLHKVLHQLSYLYHLQPNTSAKLLFHCVLVQFGDIKDQSTTQLTISDIRRQICIPHFVS